MSLGEPSPLERAPSPSGAETFAALASDVRRVLEPRLEAWLSPRVTAAGKASDDAERAARAVAELSLRGGKRVRAALVAAAYDACADVAAGASSTSPTSPSWMPAMPAMLAIELLQTYLLIHDDWMDDDATRRGGPSVHVLLREALGDRALGDAMAVLAGDLACGYAQSALLEATLPAPSLLRASRTLAKIQEDVVLGQMAEMCVGRSRSSQVPALETVHALKTASYTVVGPLALGACFAGASEARLAELEGVGQPLGVAFQLRDDLLGTFGDPKMTGKPIGNDIRQGKRTALVDALAEDPAARAVADRVLGKADASDAEIRELTLVMESSGARARVEGKIASLLAEARSRLGNIERLTPRGRAELEGAVNVLGERSS